MPDIFTIESTVMLAVSLALLAVKIFALVTSLMFSPEHYRAAGKLTKPTWVAILGLGVVANVVLGGSIGLINVASRSRRWCSSPTSDRR